MASPFTEPFEQQAGSGTELVVLVGAMVAAQFGVQVDTDPLDTEGLPEKVTHRPAPELGTPYCFLTWNDRKTLTVGFGLARKTFRRKTYTFLLRCFQLVQGTDAGGNAFEELLEQVADFAASHPRLRARATVVMEPEAHYLGVRRAGANPPVRYHLGEVRFQVVTHDHLLLPDQGE